MKLTSHQQILPWCSAYSSICSWTWRLFLVMLHCHDCNQLTQSLYPLRLCCCSLLTQSLHHFMLCHHGLIWQSSHHPPSLPSQLIFLPPMSLCSAYLLIYDIYDLLQYNLCDIYDLCNLNFVIPTFCNICNVLGHLWPFSASLQLQPFVTVVRFYNICNLSQHLYAPHYSIPSTTHWLVICLTVELHTWALKYCSEKHWTCCYTLWL